MAGMNWLGTNPLGAWPGFAARGAGLDAAPVAAGAWLDRLRIKAVLALCAEGPGLKPLDPIGFIQGAEAPCSLRKAKTGVFPQAVVTDAGTGCR